MEQFELARCPHCNSEMRLVEIHRGYAIVCTDKNCLGGMQIKYGTNDNKEIFLATLISNWNKRKPEVRAITAATGCIEEYRKRVYNKMQEPYDEHGQCCINVLDEVMNLLRCFTVNAAVDMWLKETNGGE